MDGRRHAPWAVAGFLAVASASGLAWAPPPVPGSAPPPVPQPVDVVAAKPTKQVSAKEFRCLAMNVYWESRGQPLAGQLAVAHVTLNRAAAANFPASICGVVYQSCQFGWTCDGRGDIPAESAAWKEAEEVAQRALDGDDDPTGGALYFHQLSEHPQWAKGRYGHRVVIGQHVFFNVKDGTERQLAQAAFDP